MILELLTNEFLNRFKHEKRAQVCLWFDEKEEFARLIPFFEQYLNEQTYPPFKLLVYDPSNLRGQIWIKHQIYSVLSSLEEDQRGQQKFVIYLPLSEDRLDSPDDEGRNHLELLLEYRMTLPHWRIGGKRPTIFSFLRQAGVRLPENPSEQRRLYDGGRDSLLAKYVAKFVNRRDDFWETIVTPELIRSRLIGDVEQTLLDLAVAPEPTWDSLLQKGLAKELLQVARERFGIQTDESNPVAIVRDFVTLLALTETYLGYEEPSDFPFAERLPPLAARERCLQFLRRWLRDAESRPAWDRWVTEVEQPYNLSTWASNKNGLSYGFPHLVRSRWERTIRDFNEAAAKISNTLAFFMRTQEAIEKEAEFAKASHTNMGAWTILARLGRLVADCQTGLIRVNEKATVQELAALYVELAPVIEQQHVRIRFDAMQQSLPSIGKVADRHYAAYANLLNQRFFDLYSQQGSTEIEGIKFVTDRLQQQIWQAHERRAIVIVDALRFDCAIEIKELLDLEVQVEPLRAALPTITPVGMTAMLPLNGEMVQVNVQGNQLQLKVGGKDLSARANRLAFLSSIGADCREITEIEEAPLESEGFGNLLVVFGHEEVDHIGHGNGNNLIRHLDREVHRIAQIIRKLHGWGYAAVHVVTDHGFILMDEENLPPEVPCKREVCQLLKERFALVAAEADVPLVTFPLPWNSSMRVAVPPGMAFFKTEKSFSHGGATLQELIIPHLISRSARQMKLMEIEVVVPTLELLQASVRLIIRPKALPTGKSASSPLLPGFSQELGRTLRVDVLRHGNSVLPNSEAKEVRLEPSDDEKRLTLFFRTELGFEKGELLDLVVMDADTREVLSPVELKLSIGRNI